MNARAHTIVILTPGFPGSETDTTCLPLQQSFVKHLKELFPELHIIILSFQYPFTKKTYDWFGITVHPFSGQNEGGFSRLLLRGSINKFLNNINKDYKVIGLISFWYGECALLGHRFGTKHGIKHFCWLLGQDARQGNKYPRRAALPAKELVALSEFLRDEFERNHLLQPAHLIPSGIDATEFNSQPVLRDIDLLGAGSLIPLKRYDQFLAIIAIIKKEIPGIKAMLVGDGPEKEKLQKLIFTSGLENNVLLTGEIRRPELLHLMQRTKVFLHTSSYEGFSGVCLEALAAGAHVISFCKAMNEEIDHWQIVKDPPKMIQKAMGILLNVETDHKPVCPFLITNSVKAFGKLLGLPQLG